MNKETTRDGEFESSKLGASHGAPTYILDVKTQNCCPLSPITQPAGLSAELHTTKHITKRSYQTDVGHALAQIERPMLKVRRDKHKARDEDTSFFECLIPHIKGLSPERKMLLRMTTQESIYNFVYNQEI
jgi:hypothetical protein